MKRLLVVAGSGRSGTSIMAATIGQLGFHVPKPEVQPDQTNPNGFGEPRWVVDFHTKVLREANVHPSDARPVAWARAAEQCLDEGSLGELQNWLRDQFDGRDHVVVKDPRLLWFLPLWARASMALGATVDIVTMLRHPAEVVRSKSHWYSGMGMSDANRLAGWVNTMLLTERASRDRGRVFVHFTDMLDDWTQQIGRISSALDLPVLVNAGARQQSRADAFIDRGFHRSKAAWSDIQVPEELRDLAEQVWSELKQLAEDGVDHSDALSRLDKHRDRYLAMYQEAEAFAESSIQAEVRPLKREIKRLQRAERNARRNAQAAREQLEQQPAVPSEASSAGAIRSRVRPVAARLIGRIPAGIRHRVPLRVRRVIVDRMRA